MPISPSGAAVILCATHRLARNLRLAHDRARAAEGLARWQPLAAQTLGQWLDAVIAEALLAGEIPEGLAPRLALAPMQERVLWERVIAQAQEGGAGGDPLFDPEGLAEAALEANALIEVWGVRVAEAEAEANEETRQFMAWRAAFRAQCAAAGWLEPARHAAWQIDCLARGAGRLPARIAFAGFDRYSPQEERLMRVLRERGVEVDMLPAGRAETAQAHVTVLPDRAAECRAAALWAQRRLAAAPGARLGIVAPELSAVRDRLADELDARLHPGALRPALAEATRRYNFSLGAALARQTLVDSALRLLRLAASPRRVEQAELGALLRQPYWSADLAEADARARLDAAMRAALPPVVSLERVLRFARKAAGQGLGVSRLSAHLDALAALSHQPRQLPSAWIVSLRETLAQAGWPGERTLSSHEFQAKRAFEELLEELRALDALLGRIPAAEAQRRLTRLARERIFQPQTEGEPQVEIMGPLEAAGAQFDALWVMGMNDHLWPPAARPNPLLPAQAQRRVRAPNASHEVQGEFVRGIHARLLRSAPEVIFSLAAGEGDRPLRPSPLVAGLPRVAPPAPDVPEAQAAPLEKVSDSQAPPVAEGERVKGGTGLLKAQAICPAWAFYRHRLGARALEEPVEGLAPTQRGTLIHAVLERFWQGRASDELRALSSEALAAEIAQAVDAALAEFNDQLEAPLPARFLALERERLIGLVAGWVALELERAVPFRVAACELGLEIEIEGIAVRLVIDRIDELPDGARVILDYKTGEADAHSWARSRITEPQLPIYAALVPAQSGDEGPVAAVAFGRVRAADAAFAGIAADNGLLPGVAGLADKNARRLFPEESFPDWPAVIEHWRRAIAAVAAEVRQGEASVRFDNDKDLRYCEVLPILRLPERHAQWLAQAEEE